MIKCSLIIPVFNSSKYLSECLDSVINQTLKSIEIICINDGSTDNSLEILNRYRSIDPRISIFSQQNHGAASARNVGLDNARGEYIYFLDSDDYLTDNKALESLTKEMDNNNLDVLLFNGTSKYGSPELAISFPSYKSAYVRRADYSNDIDGLSMLCTMILSKEFFASPCLYMSRKSTLKRIKLRFIEGIIYEDEPFFRHLLLNIKKIKCIHTIYFCRRVREDSVMTQKTKNAVHFLSDWTVYKEKEAIVLNVSDHTKQLILTQDLLKTQMRLFETWQRINLDKNYIEIIKILNSLTTYERTKIIQMGININYSQNGYIAFFPYNKIPKNSKIILYGAGAIGKMYFYQIISSQYCKLVAWADRKHQNIDNENSLLISIHNIPKYDFDYIIISIHNPDKAHEIQSTLVSAGIDKEKIIWYPIIYI